MTGELGTTVTLTGAFDDAVARVTAALKAEGFGVLTQIDVRETLKQKLDVAFRPYMILGACNPPLAYRALSLAPEIGLLLPCNVTVSEVAPGQIDVGLVDPTMMMSVTARPELAEVAGEARAKLERVAAALRG
jgi:uncharacterized protein (DUF302 family)